jgi:hypothetical protein
MVMGTIDEDIRNTKTNEPNHKVKGIANEGVSVSNAAAIGFVSVMG